MTSGHQSREKKIRYKALVRWFSVNMLKFSGLGLIPTPRYPHHKLCKLQLEDG